MFLNVIIEITMRVIYGLSVHCGELKIFLIFLVAWMLSSRSSYLRLEMHLETLKLIKYSSKMLEDWMHVLKTISLLLWMEPLTPDIRQLFTIPFRQRCHWSFCGFDNVQDGTGRYFSSKVIIAYKRKQCEEKFVLSIGFFGIIALSDHQMSEPNLNS